jgi:hypothetical protein
MTYGAAWLLGDFWKASLGRGGIASERARLERLAADLREAETR